MGRRTVDYTVDQNGGRDAGKTFQIREMPALQAERLGLRAVTAMIRAGVEVGEFNVDDPGSEEGMRKLAAVGVMSLIRLPYDDLVSIIDELMECVSTVTPTGMVMKRLPDDIEEIDTLGLLQTEVVKLHTDFFKRLADRFSSTPVAKTSQVSSTTRTSQSS